MSLFQWPGVITNTHNISNRAPSIVLASSPSVKNNRDSRNEKPDNSVVVAIVGLVLELGAICVASYVASILITKLLKNVQGGNYDGGGGDADPAVLSAAEKRLRYLLERDGRTLRTGATTATTPPELILTNYERQIAQDVVDPHDISISFADIGGIDAMKQEIYELAVLPLLRPDLFSSSHLLQPPGGILLYGPPGTGKTMLAKAIAKEADATFIAVKLSKIMSKWFGGTFQTNENTAIFVAVCLCHFRLPFLLVQFLPYLFAIGGLICRSVGLVSAESNKLIDATFSLARKLAPSIIFVDELDTFLNPRDGSENSAGNAIKAEFLTLWDGISTNMAVSPVLVLGATNRPNQVDSAILRRLPRMFRIELPNAQGRLDILKLTLKGHALDASARAYLPLLAKNLKGYSGSDLKELCQCAALESVREVIKEQSYRAVMSSTNGGGSPSSPTKATTMAATPILNTERRTLSNSSSSTTPTSSTAAGSSSSPATTTPLRAMSKRDLVVAQTKVKRTGHDAEEYEREQYMMKQRQQQQQPFSSSDGPAMDPALLQQLAAFAQVLTGVNHHDGRGSNGGQPLENDDDDAVADSDDEIPQLF